MKRIPIDGDYVYGAISLQAHRDGIQPWRLPHSEHALYATFGDITAKAEKPSGVRIRFETNSQMVELEADFDVSEEPNSYLCLSCNNEILTQQKVNSNESIWRFALPESGMCAYEIWLPVFATAKLRSLGVEEGFSLMPTEDARLKWLTYGSSITHCRSSENPCLTWPSVAARKHDLNLTSMGYGGECHLDSNIGRAMRDCDADIITMKLGINVYANSSLNSRTFCPAVIGMIQVIREKHPRTPIGLITPIYACERETNKNAVGMTLEDYRQELRRAWDALRSYGDDKVFLFEGFELLNPQEAHLLPDNLHPSAEGYVMIGERAASKILPELLDAR